MSSNVAIGNLVYGKERHCIEWKISNFSKILERSSIFTSKQFLLDNELAAFKLLQVVKGSDVHDTSSTSNYFLDFGVHRSTDNKLYTEQLCKMGFKSNDDFTHNFRILAGGICYIIVNKNECLEVMRNYIPNGDITVFAEFLPRHQIGIIDPSPSSTSFESAENYQTEISNFDSNENTGVDDLLGSLKNMYINEEACDLFIYVKGHEFKAHRCILSSRSEVFASILQYDMLEESNSRLTVQDCEPEIFREFFLYLYTGKVENFSYKNAFGLYSVANKFGVVDLASSCVDYLKSNLSIDMFCDIIELAVSHKEDELLEISKKYFLKNACNILRTQKWLTFFETNAKLSSDHFLLPLAELKSK